jgi:hypothetical protein
MPPRLFTLAIVIAWIGMTSWLFYRDVWPRIRPGEPPPLASELDIEVTSNRAPVHWTVFKNGKESYVLKTETAYDKENDLVKVSSELKPKPGTPKDAALMERMTLSCEYVITREGELRKSSITLELPPFVQARMDGDVRDGLFYSRVSALDLSKELKPVPVETKGSAQNPLQPQDRFSRLSPGQRWRVPLSSPLLDALAGLIPGIKENSVQFLDAEVLRERQSFPFGPREEDCMIIEYNGDDVHGRTWVRVSDGFVLKQEMTLHGDEWEIRRIP